MILLVVGFRVFVAINMPYKEDFFQVRALVVFFKPFLEREVVE